MGMKEYRIVAVEARDARFPLTDGAGTDAIHSGSEYAFAATLLTTPCGEYGTGIVLTLGQGNELVCQAIQLLAKAIVGQEIENLMAQFGKVSRQLSLPQILTRDHVRLILEIRYRFTAAP